MALSFTPLAAAQSAGDKAQAEALFQAGKDLMSAGKYADACTKFEASQRLDAGVGTMLYLADCYEKAGKLASAWATFHEAESVAMQRSEGSRAAVAKKRAAALDARLPKLSVKVASGNPEDTTIKQNGTTVPKESWGLALPVDAGPVKLEASAAGKKTWSTTITVTGEATMATAEVPVLEDAPAEEKPPAAAAATAAAPVETKAPAEAPAEGSGQRTAGLVVGGIGVVGLGVGSFFGLRAKSKNDESKKYCPTDPNLCSSQGVDLRDSAKSSATMSTVFMVGGGALLAGGLVIFLTAPSSSQSKEAATLRIGGGVAPGEGRVTVGGTF